MIVRAAVLDKVGARLDVRNIELGPPRKGEVRIQMRATGVCHSDWHLVTGDTGHVLPVVLGHEGAGTVEEVGEDVESLKVGDRVALNWAPYCGTCFYCSRSQFNLCETYVGPMWAGTMLDGSTRFSEGGNPIYHYCALACFADQIVVPDVCCVPMADEVPYEIAAVIGCAVMTGVGSVLNTAKVESGSSIAVVGCGGVGLSTIMGAKFAGAAQILAIDPFESRRNAAMDLGATCSIDPNDDVLSLVRESTNGRGADYVFEAVGDSATQELCLELARPGGKIVFSGLTPMGSSTNLPGSVIVRQEKAILGSYYGTANPPRDFSRIAEAYLRGELPLDRLVETRRPLEQVNEAFDEMIQGRTRRGVIEWT